MPKKKPIKGKPKVNKELEGLEIQINEFGQINTNFDIRDINKFLNRNVDDKKLRDRTDISEEGEFTNKPDEEMELEDELIEEGEDDIEDEELKTKMKKLEEGQNPEEEKEDE